MKYMTEVNALAALVDQNDGLENGGLGQYVGIMASETIQDIAFAIFVFKTVFAHFLIIYPQPTNKNRSNPNPHLFLLPLSTSFVSLLFANLLLPNCAPFYSYFSQPQQQMSFQLLFLILLSLQPTHSQQPQLIDFAFTHLLIHYNHSQTTHQHSIHISPDSYHLQQYHFPEVCELKSQLEQGGQSSGTVDHFINSEDYLQTLRGKVLSLLKQSQQIKNSRNYLSEITKYLKFDEDQTSVAKYKSQVQWLAKNQQALVSTRQRIDNLNSLLDSKVQHYNSHPKNEQFKTASLNFQIQSCNSKIAYLQQLKQKSISQSTQQSHNNFTDFFASLGLDMTNQSLQIEFINQYFQNMTHIKYLKEMAESLTDNIEVDRLNLQYKKSCDKEKVDLKNKGSSHDEIKATLQHLRQKKKQLGSNTKYCEGVAIKLEMQIKRLLKAVNWTFFCADDVKELQYKLQGQLKSLKKVEEQISNYSESALVDYQRDFKQIKQTIKNKFQRLESFTINQYTHQPEELEKIIAETERLKAEAQQKLKILPKQTSGDHSFAEIKELAEQIKKEKAKFCQQFTLYQKERAKLWLDIYQFESAIRYSSRMRGQYIRQAQKLEQLQKQYKQMSELIIAEIQANYQMQ